MNLKNKPRSASFRKLTMLCRAYMMVAIMAATITPGYLRAQSLENQVRKFLTNAMEKEKIPGLAYAVIEKGKVQTKGTMGFADLSWKQPVTLETAFQLASVSKVFCGILLCRMFDAGLLSPEQKISTLIDSIPLSWKDITVLQLANHQSGIKIGDFSQATTTKQALEIAKQQSLQFQPGESDAYVSSDYWILQYIIEKVSGLSYFEALQTYVTRPLKMDHTFVDNWSAGRVQMSEIVPMQAKVYHFWQKPDRFVEGNFPFVSTGYSAGGIYTSVNDLIKLMLAMDDRNFLKPKSYSLLTTSMPLKSKQGSFGLGFMVYPYQGYKIVGHSGGPALADVARFEDKGVTVIVLSNQRGFYPYLARSIASFYIKGLKAEGPPADYKF